MTLNTICDAKLKPVLEGENAIIGIIDNWDNWQNWNMDH